MDFSQWTNLIEVWMSGNGVCCLDTNAQENTCGFYRAQEHQVEAVRQDGYGSNQWVWSVVGGRLGRSYLLQASEDGQTWANIQTNTVQTNAFLFQGPTNVWYRVQ